jgi:hypothetical protein
MFAALLAFVSGMGLLFAQVIGIVPPSLAVSLIAYVLTLPSVALGLWYLFTLAPSRRK